MIILLAPIAPHIAEELWGKMGAGESVFETSWPRYDATAIIKEEFPIVIPVNGKLRSKIAVTADLSDEQIQELALADEKTKKWIEGKEIKKVIVVPKKLVNVVVR